MILASLEAFPSKTLTKLPIAPIVPIVPVLPIAPALVKPPLILWPPTTTTTTTTPAPCEDNDPTGICNAVTTSTLALATLLCLNLADTCQKTCDEVVGGYC